ncbi:MAG: cytochrome P450 [Vicinamibacterales bacterium]
MTAPASAWPPGPPRSVRNVLPIAIGRDALGFLLSLKRDYGDIAHTRAAGEDVILLSDPQFVKDVLMTHQRNFRKGRGLERARKLLGDGLLTSEGDTHLRQRRLIQPAFHKERIASYASAMTHYADRVQGGWVDGGTIDVAGDMMRLTLGVVGRTLFDADVESQARDVGTALTDVLDSFWTTMLPYADLLEKLPIPQLRRGREARARLDAIVYGLIAERRRHPGDRGDLLSMLLLAQDEEQGGRGMTDAQVRDEAMTIFLAGHETTANALAWTWYLLSENPEAERRLHDEVDRVLGGRLPTMADIPQLKCVEQVITESMRLYPPAWLIGRRAIGEYRVGGFTLPPRTIVLVSPYVMHRDPRWFAEPERFMPGRWTPEFKAQLPQFAYFPFGGGARRCIGESFAWMELVLVAATIAQRWRLRLVPGHPVVPQPVVTLRMKHGLRMTAARRSPLA